jgi:hypothetical protein
MGCSIDNLTMEDLAHHHHTGVAEAGAPSLHANNR